MGKTEGHYLNIETKSISRTDAKPLCKQKNKQVGKLQENKKREINEHSACSPSAS